MMRSTGFKVLLLVAVLTALLGAAGCEISHEPDRIKVYFENTNATKLVTVDYHPKAAEDLDIVWELFDYMQNAVRSDTVAAVPASLKLSYAEINQNTLTLDLKGSYDDMPSNSKLLMAAALTKTMTQLDSVTYLLLKINGEMAKDAGGDEYGILRSALFVDVAADDPNNFINSNITLYYSNAAGDRLVREDLSVIYRRGTSLERTVVEQLIRGPQMGNGNAKRTLPSTMSVLSIAVTDRICYVNLSQDLQYESLGVFNYIPIYSIVDSLASLNTVDKVQILVNGSVLTTDLGENVSVSTPLDPDYKYIDGAMQ
jgi:germination protein M